MTNDATPGNVPLIDLLGPLPEPVAWFRAPYGTLEPNPLFRVTGPQSLEWAVACYTEYQMRAAVAAERERMRATIADDAYAATFQSMGQYRSALLRALRA